MRKLLSTYARENDMPDRTARLKRENAGVGTITPSGWVLTAEEWRIVEATPATIKKGND